MASVNLPHNLPTGGDYSNSLNMLVEIPKGSINKYEIDIENGAIKLDRVLYEQIPYPIEYGLLPQTWDEDEDMLDVMSFITYPTFPGCIIKVRPIGVMNMIDCGLVDDKILAVPQNDIRFKSINDLSDVSEHALDEIRYFFINYKKWQLRNQGLVGKSVEVKGWGNKQEALKIIEKSVNLYKSKFSK